jgi:hypothetical protein
MAITLGDSKVVLDTHPIRHGKQWYIQAAYPSGYKASLLSFESEAEAAAWLKRIAENPPKSRGTD